MIDLTEPQFDPALLPPPKPAWFQRQEVRVAREEANWEGLLDGLQQGVFERSHARLAADWAGVEQQHMQQKLDADCRRHICCTAAAGGLQQPDMVVQPGKALPCLHT